MRRQGACTLAVFRGRCGRGAGVEAGGLQLSRCWVAAGSGNSRGRRVASRWVRKYMERHTEPETVTEDARGSYEACGSQAVSPLKTAGPSPGVDEKSESVDAGIPSGGSSPFDPRELVAERLLMRFVLDQRPRSRRAAAAVLKRFAERQGLRIYRLGRNRLYRARDFFEALTRESRVCTEHLRRAAE